MNFQVVAKGWNRRALRFAVGTLTVALYAAMVLGAVGDTTADRVLGQFDFSHNIANLVDAHGFNGLGSLAIDASATPNRLYVADGANNRVLGYKDVTTFTNGGAADLVMGQPDFISGKANNGGLNADSLDFPTGVAVDLSGNLYVADSGDNRVLEYSAPFAGCASLFPCVGGSAAVVFGQAGSFTSSLPNNGGRSANSLLNPVGVVVDASGNLYVADQGNHRILEYTTPLTTDTTADTVFGQGGSFTAGICPSFGTSADSLCFPRQVALDGSGNLYVADPGSHRILEYNTPQTTDTTADIVFGQGGDFTTSTDNHGGLSADSLSGPTGVAVDSSGNLYVADNTNNRVLEYNTPLSSGTTADTVFGQAGSFTTATFNNGGLSATSLAHPVGVAVDVNGNLYVSDGPNSRVLK